VFGQETRLAGEKKNRPLRSGPERPMRGGMTDSFRGSAPAGTGASTGTSGATALSDNDAAALSAVLWRERELLEDLLFRLAAQQHLLGGGAVRWLSRLDADVERAAQAVQDHEIVRATEVEFITHRLNLGSDVPLTVLADSAQEPWAGLLTEHLDELRSLMREIETASSENQRLLRTGEQATREALERSVGASSSEGGDYGRGLGYRGSKNPAYGAHMLDTRA
jgi:hypothetical protein